MTLTITHSKWDAEEDFQALGFDDSEPNMVIRFVYSTQDGWQKWRHGGWLPIKPNDVPEAVMLRYRAAGPGPLERPKGDSGTQTQGCEVQRQHSVLRL